VTHFNFDRPTQRHWLFLARIALLLAVIFLFLGSIKSDVNTGVEVSDKVLHFLGYGIFAGVIAAAFPKMGLLRVFLSASVFGGLMEVFQHIAPTGRHASLWDQIANIGGALAAVSLWAGLIVIFHILNLKKTTP